MHHIATDGWSHWPAVDRTDHGLRRPGRGTAARPARTPPSSTPTLAAWQRRCPHARRTGAAAGLLAGPAGRAPPLDLPLDRPRPAVASAEGGVVTLAAARRRRRRRPGRRRPAGRHPCT
ncbi:hypothetical protein LT493_00540 [Streptomyces tricolor]|nr:hypothetical protein [Streptomyces tricolor]